MPAVSEDITTECGSNCQIIYPWPYDAPGQGIRVARQGELLVTTWDVTFGLSVDVNEIIVRLPDRFHLRPNTGMSGSFAYLRMGGGDNPMFLGASYQGRDTNALYLYPNNFLGWKANQGPFYTVGQLTMILDQ